MPYKPKSIKDEGLQQYLDRTRAEHRGLGYADFEQRMQLGVSKPKIARDFGMSTTRIWFWVNLYKQVAHDQS
jgi:hypothetical protein